MASSGKIETGSFGIFYEKKHPRLGVIRALDPWAVEHGIHIIRGETDAAEGIMMVEKEDCQQYGTVHGGMLVAFADTVAGHSLVPHGKVCVTQSSTVNFLRPAKGEYLLCRAVPQKIGGRICVVSVEAKNDAGELVITALFTFAVVKEIEPIITPPKHERFSF